jgi:hypothetical protein
LSGGSWIAALPLANLQFRQLGRVARSEDATEASTQFVIDFLQQVTVSLVALVNHNISFGGRWVIEAANEIEFSTFLYSASSDAWAALGGAEWVLDELEWESDNFWLGTYSLDEVEGLTPLAFHILPMPVAARFWRIRVIDTGNEDGHVDIGRAFIGPSWSPIYNMSFGASTGYEDPTVVDVAMGGAEYFDQRDPYRVMRFSLELLKTGDEGFAKVLEITRRAGTSGEVLVIPDADDLENAQRRNFLGRLRQLSPLEQNMQEYGSMTFEIKELK